MLELEIDSTNFELTMLVIENVSLFLAEVMHSHFDKILLMQKLSRTDLPANQRGPIDLLNPKSISFENEKCHKRLKRGSETL